MIEYKTITFKGAEEYSYCLLQKKIYVTGYNLGHWELRTPENTVVAKCLGSIVVVYPGYMWDGSTVIGEYYEDKVTLESAHIIYTRHHIK